MNCSVNLCLAFLCLTPCLYCKQVNQSPKSEYQKFDDFTSSVYSKERVILAESLNTITNYDHLPTSDGMFSDFIDMLCSLPFEQSDAIGISTILSKQDSYFQEAGVKLVTAYSKRWHDFDRFDQQICDILTASTVDPWVLTRINNYIKATYWVQNKRQTRLYACYSKAIFEPIKPRCLIPTPGSVTGIARNLIPNSVIDGQIWILVCFLNSDSNPDRQQAMLPFVEKFLRSKGLENSKEAIRKFLDNKDKVGFRVFH